MIRLEAWHIPYSFRDIQSILLASPQNTEYKSPSSFVWHPIDRLPSFCWWKPILKILGFSALQVWLITTRPLSHLTHEHPYILFSLISEICDPNMRISTEANHDFHSDLTELAWPNAYGIWSNLILCTSQWGMFYVSIKFVSFLDIFSSYAA